MAKKNWLERFLTPDADRAERRSPEKFAAYRWAGSGMKQDPVRDVSTTGVYIVTEERWPIDTLVSLTLQREGYLELLAERRITAHARVVRHGSQGLGLAFVVPKDPEQTEWKNLLDRLVRETPHQGMESLVRLAEAIKILSVICPSGAKEISELLCAGLSSHKVNIAMDIVLHAQSIFVSNAELGSMKIPPAFVHRILSTGTVTDEDWLHQLWAGLLVSSCSPDGKDESNLRYIDLFAQLTPVPTRIFTVVCAVSSKYLSEAGVVTARPLACKLEEIMAAAGSRGAQIERELQRLTELALIEKKTPSATTVVPSREVIITPSTRGLELFARCNGYLGPAKDFYTLEQARPAAAK
jgi:hypothetical protein